MQRPPMSFMLALLAVGLAAWLTAAFFPVLGLASSALLFLLPVLFASVRGGLGPGLLAALAGAVAYNFLLLPPRFSFRVHGPDNLISVLVFVAVALVTSRLAARLQLGRAEALERAAASEDAAALSATLGQGDGDTALASGLAWIDGRYGAVRLIGQDDLPEEKDGFSSLDMSAAAWALHNGDVTGHGTEIMAASDWTFLPLARGGRGDGGIAALARPATGLVRSEVELAHIQQLIFLLGQAADRAALNRERHERERLEDGDRLRRSLLASLAHDLRTPLTVITGQLENLARSNPEAQEALAGARRLDRMMEDLLGAARLESGQLVARPESMDLIDVIATACSAVAIPPGLTLERAIAPDLPFVNADPTLLQHILLNLLDNAARHARNRILLSARQAGGSVLLAVCDDGPGVPVAERTRIFDRFIRLEGSDRTLGSGLGLAIAKGFADAMGMSIAVEDGLNGGACFVLGLPVPDGGGTV